MEKLKTIFVVLFMNVRSYFLSPARAILDDLANIFTLAGFALAFYAVANPGTVSDFLQEIADETKASSESLQSIDTSSADTAENTNLIAAEIPTWLQTTHYKTAPLPDRTYVNMTICNPSNVAFRVDQVRYDVIRRGTSRTLGGPIDPLTNVVLPPRECADGGHWIEASSVILIDICIVASELGSSNLLGEIRRYDMSEKLVNWHFGEIESESECANEVKNTWPEP